MFGRKSQPESEADIRGVKDYDLIDVSDSDLVMLALARLYEALGVEDDALTRELYRRGRRH